MNSTQLIEYFNKRKEALGEKATDFTMFMEGYGAGIADLDVRNAIVKETIDKAVRWLNDNKVRDDIVGYFLDTQREEMRDEFIEEFKKAMEE